MSRLLAVTKVEIKLFFRNFYSVFFGFVFPVGMLLLFGSIYGNEPSEFMNGYGSMDYSVPAYSCMVLAVTGLMSLPLTIADYRDRKILKRLMASPVHPSQLLMSQLIVNLLMTMVGIFLLIFLGVVLYNVKFMGSLLPMLLAFLLTTLSIFSIGLLIAGLMPNGKAVNLVSYLIYFPMLFLSGATFPMQMLPDSVQTVAKFLPLTYGVRLMQGVWLGNDLSGYGLEIIVLVGILVVCSSLALSLFKWE